MYLNGTAQVLSVATVVRYGVRLRLSIVLTASASYMLVVPSFGATRRSCGSVVKQTVYLYIGVHGNEQNCKMVNHILI